MISYPIYYRVEIFLSIVKSPISDFLLEGKFWKKKDINKIKLKLHFLYSLTR